MNIRSDDERELHRVRIAHEDLTEAVQFIDEAQALGAVDPKTHVTHRALMYAAVVLYARPFLNNEHRNEKRRPPGAADSTSSPATDALDAMWRGADQNEQMTRFARTLSRRTPRR